MDSVSEIKARISIEQLVGQYVQLQKKGRNFVGLCPFHHDSKPSFLVSPDKGICYCFPCQKGGDIFSFYQLIEGVDFKEALKNLAEQAGVTLPDLPKDTITKDEKERARDCLAAAEVFYAHRLKESAATLEYLKKRGLTDAEIAEFGLGFAPDSYTETYDHLLKVNFSRSEIVASGMGVQSDLKEGRVHDRFRNRLMFPIHDQQGRIIGFGGRTMGNDDAKYLNTPDSPLYRKSAILYGLHRALKPMRDKKRVILVEGYFDVLACHRAGMTEAVATCGTALTDEHVKLLKRSVETVVLCLDSDRAGRDAADRGFILCAREGLRIEGVRLGQKDPADAAVESLDLLRSMLTQSHPYLDLVLADIRTTDLSSPAVRQAALERLLPLLQALSSSTERTHALRQCAAALGVTETAFADDLHRFEQGQSLKPRQQSDVKMHTAAMYSASEITLTLFLLYPRMLSLIDELVPPEEEFALRLYSALIRLKDRQVFEVADVELDELDRERCRVLMLYCEENGFADWNDSIAVREIRNNCRTANRDYLHRHLKDITQSLLQARSSGDKQAEADLSERYAKLIQMERLAR